MAVGVATLLVLALTGCGDKSDGSANSTDSADGGSGSSGSGSGASGSGSGDSATNGESSGDSDTGTPDVVDCDGCDWSCVQPVVPPDAAAFADLDCSTPMNDHVTLCSGTHLMVDVGGPIDGACVSPLSGECSSDGDCASGELCQARDGNEGCECRPGCRDDDACASDEACIDVRNIQVLVGYENLDPVSACFKARCRTGSECPDTGLCSFDLGLVDYCTQRPVLTQVATACRTLDDTCLTNDDCDKRCCAATKACTSSGGNWQCVGDGCGGSCGI